MNISSYTENERMFLAGSLKAMVLSDDSIGEEEISDLNHITEQYGFDDFEQALEAFESKVKDNETYLDLARGIYRKEVQDDILTMLTELSFQEGYPTGPESKILLTLKEIWKIG